jgi:hypothetical protein
MVQEEKRKKKKTSYARYAVAAIGSTPHIPPSLHSAAF